LTKINKYKGGLHWNDIDDIYPSSKYYMSRTQYQDWSPIILKILEKTGEKTASGRDIYKDEPVAVYKQSEEDNLWYEIQTESTKIRKVTNFLQESDMGGVSAPMATLNNTPGIGNAVPPSQGNVGSGDSWGTSVGKSPYTQAATPTKKKTKKKKSNKEKTTEVVENNINPYDKIGTMMAKKMGVKLPFKQINKKKNQNAIKSSIKEHQIPTLDEYLTKNN